MSLEAVLLRRLYLKSIFSIFEPRVSNIDYAGAFTYSNYEECRTMLRNAWVFIIGIEISKLLVTLNTLTSYKESFVSNDKRSPREKKVILIRRSPR